MIQELKISDNNYRMFDEDPEEEPSFENYVLSEEEEEEEEQNEDNQKPTISAITLLLKVMFNPVEGWKSVRRSKMTAEKFQSDCFYPLLALVALGKFAEYFYLTGLNLSNVLIGAILGFVSFFFGYFCIMIVLKIILPSQIAEVIDTNYGRIYILLSLSTLAIFYTFTELLPMLTPIFFFFPLWTIYLMCKGIRFFKLPDNKTLLVNTILCISVIGVPIILDWIFDIILP